MRIECEPRSYASTTTIMYDSNFEQKYFRHNSVQAQLSFKVVCIGLLVRAFFSVKKEIRNRNIEIVVLCQYQNDVCIYVYFSGDR